MAVRRGPTALAGQRYKRSRSLRVLLAAQFGYLGRFRKLIVVAATLTIIATIFRAIDPLILANGINLVLVPGAPLSAVLYLGITYVGLRAASWLLSSMYTWILSGAQAGYIRSLQQDIYKNLDQSRSILFPRKTKWGYYVSCNNRYRQSCCRYSDCH